jgi:hypothetical protein
MDQNPKLWKIIKIRFKIKLGQVSEIKKNSSPVQCLQVWSYYYLNSVSPTNKTLPRYNWHLLKVALNTMTLPEPVLSIGIDNVMSAIGTHNVSGDSDCKIWKTKQSKKKNTTPFVVIYKNNDLNHFPILKRNNSKMFSDAKDEIELHHDPTRTCIVHWHR